MCIRDRADAVRAKIVVDGIVLEQVRKFEYMSCNVSNISSNDMVTKLHNFNRICGIIRRTL